MPNEIEQAVALIDQKIESLKKLRDQLVQEFGQSAPLKAVAASVPGLNGGGRVNRKDQVADYIRLHGPSSRPDIIAGTGIPVGTVAYVLNDKERFQARRGKWNVIEQKDSAVTSAE
jgi:hypothetical protein